MGTRDAKFYVDVSYVCLNPAYLTGVNTMIESVIMMLIWLCVLAIAIYLVIWVLEQLGISIPPQVMKIIWVIVVLVVVLMLVKNVLPSLGVRLSSVAYTLVS